MATAVYRYDYILNKYGVGTTLPKHPNFMNRSIPSKMLINSSSIFSLISGEEADLSAIIIIFASSIALLSVTALSVLVVKKRKHQEQ